jgi:serine/threonine protein kinase
LVPDLSSDADVKAIGASVAGEVQLLRSPDGSELAVKCFSQNPDCDFDQVMFSREIEESTRLRHPCMIAVLGFVLPTRQSGPKLATKFIRGGSLKTVLESRPGRLQGWLQGTALAKIVAGIDLGMRFAHSHGCVHCDLKPSNILLDEEQLARIGDLSVRRRNDVDTPLYTAPEMAEDEYTNKADVFSFAMILYELIVGKKTFPDSMQLRQVMMKICQANGARSQTPYCHSRSL